MSQAAARDPIQEFVQSAAVHIRKTELLYGWMILLSTLLFSTLVFILVDHWIWEINRPVRILLWLSLALWSAWWFLKRVLPPMRYKIHPEYAARQFELQDPRSKDSLISWIQLNQSANAAPKSVLNFVGRYAFGFLRNSDASQVADSANLIRLSAAFFGCLLCTLIYFFASPKSGLTSAARMLMPWANIAPATRVQFERVSPGASTIMQGSSLPIDVIVKGLHKSEKVTLRYDLSDGQERGQTIEMKEEIQGINYKLDFGKDSGGLHQPLTYWIHAGDAVAGPFDVGIQIVPLVAIDHIDLKFPDYTNLKPRSIQQQGHFEAPEGTVAQFHAIANQTMQSARIEFDPVMQNKLFISARDFLDMKVDKTQLEASWTATIDRKNSIEKKITSYRIHAVNELKESNHDPVIYQIKIIPDLPPEVEFSGNSNLAVEVPIDQGVLIELTARDPDYGLSSVEIQGTNENKLNPKEPKVLFRQSLFQADPECPRTKNAQYTFVPLDHGLKSGDEIDLIAVAYDNYHDPISKQLEPQRAFSQPLKIRIVKPEDKPDGKQESEKTETTNSDSNIAQAQPPSPKSRVDWDRFRENNPRNDPKSKSRSNDQETQPNDQNKTKQTADSPSGQGGNQSGTQKSNSNKQDPNSQSTPPSGMPSPDSDPNSPQTPNASPSDSSNPSNGSSQKQDRDALEKIQQFMKESQRGSPSDQQNQENSSNPGNPNSDPNGSNQSNSNIPDTDTSMPNPTNRNGTNPDSNDKTGNDKTGNDKTGNDKTGNDKTGNDKTGNDKTGNDKTGNDKTGNDKTGNDKTGNDKTGNDKTGNDKTGNDKTGNDKTGNDKSGNDKSGNDKSGSSKSGTEGGSKETGPESNQNPQRGPEQKSPESATEQEQGDGKGSGDKQGGKQPQPNSNQPNDAGSGMNQTGRTPANGVAAGEGPSQSAEFGSDQAKEEYSRKAGEMLLEYIDRQRDQPDSELLKRLNWNADDFRRFADRWKQAKEEAKLDPNKRIELEETLRNLGLSGTGQKINRLKDRNDALRGMQEEGGRLRPPESLREQFEAFRKAAGKLGK